MQGTDLLQNNIIRENFTDHHGEQESAYALNRIRGGKKEDNQRL